MKSFIISLFILFSNTLNANNCMGFIDVSDTDAICEDLTFAKESLWISGYPNGTFDDKAINRAEFIKIVLNAVLPMSLGLRDCWDPNNIGVFEIQKTEWYSGYVCTALEDLKIVKGDGIDNLFHPEHSINYVEALKIILKALGYKGYENIGDTWYLTYTNEASSMNLPVYDFNHIMTRAESIHLIRDVYLKYLKRALLESTKWEKKKDCDAKKYHFFKLNRTPTCKERWAKQIYLEEGYKILTFGSSVEASKLQDIERTKEIVDNSIKLYMSSSKLYGTIKNGVPIQKLKNKTLLTVLKNNPKRNEKTAMEKTLENVAKCAISTLKQGKPINKACTSVGLKTVNNFLGAHKIYGTLKKLTNYQIAKAYLQDFYDYGMDNGLVALHEAKVSRSSNMYETIENYAINSGYKNSRWWYDEYDVNVIVDMVEEIKRNTLESVDLCYIKRECLAQEQHSALEKLKIYTPYNGVQLINY